MNEVTNKKNDVLMNAYNYNTGVWHRSSVVTYKKNN